ncbi:MAG: hypothetical protein ACXWKC_10255 [Xanthobacteraceae bacterium]
MSYNGPVELLEGILKEITDATGHAALDRFSSLREVDAKVREAKHTIATIQGLPQSFTEELSTNPDFQMQSRRVRLEALAIYIRSAIKFAKSGALTQPEKVVHQAPDVSKLTAGMPTLKAIIDKRWQEAQRCTHAECYTSAVILMGSILEGLLLGRTMLSVPVASQSPKVPKNKQGLALAVQDWSLSALIDVAVDVGWVKTDRGKFSHALRESRNVVHPWVAAATRADFDIATCRTSWEVLQASVDDLLASV